VTFRAIDLSTNGISGGPVHADAKPLQVSFQAGATRQLERAESLEPGTEWWPIGTPVVGNDYFIEVTDPDPPATARVHRVRDVPSTP
jgi:hypothetical protein